MDVHGVLQFIRKTSDLELFLNKFLLQVMDFILELRNIVSLLLGDLESSVLVPNFISKMLDIIESFSVLGLSLSQSRLLNLDLFVQKGQFIILSDELGTQNISLADNGFIFLLKLLSLLLRFSDNEL